MRSPSSPRPARTRLRDSSASRFRGFGSFGDASFGGEKLRAKGKHRRGVHADDGLGATRDDGALRAIRGNRSPRDDAIGRRRDRDRTVASELGRDADADAAERVVVLVGARAGIVAVAASSSRSMTIRRRRAPRASASVVVVVAVLAAVPETAPRGSAVGVVELAAVPEGDHRRAGVSGRRGAATRRRRDVSRGRRRAAGSGICSRACPCSRSRSRSSRSCSCSTSRETGRGSGSSFGSSSARGVARAAGASRRPYPRRASWSDPAHSCVIIHHRYFPTRVDSSGSSRRRARRGVRTYAM